MVAFLRSNLIPFRTSNKVKGIPISGKLISNMTVISSNTICVHHSHITGDILGYAHLFCNEKVRENYFKIPVVAHNLFRFEFFS